MRRSTTTMALLVSVTVTAVSGCVGVDRTSAGPGGAAPTGSPERSAGAGDRPPPVPEPTQAPGHDRLQRAGAPPAVPARAATIGTAPAPAAPAPPDPPPTAAPADAPVRVDRPPKPPRPEPRQRPPRRPEKPSRPPAQARGETDICALGERFGRWRPDSPEAVICREVYGD
ncbi:hypothetical protein [Streptomyces sp. CC224B]|uniref:hypothetical protein n=1 Tax=Streptomyces sp. CC224B TaxID=3044571 RepID=UPI0024A85DA9|nr:hypothetical protein [Streptomyces sp. CC224B]